MLSRNRKLEKLKSQCLEGIVQGLWREKHFLFKVFFGKEHFRNLYLFMNPCSLWEGA